MRRIRHFVLAGFVALMSSCARLQSFGLPEGITALPNIEHYALQSPIWSPDGSHIVASYVSESMPDIIAFFGPESRHEIVMIDTATWQPTIIASQESGYMRAEVWLPDSRGFAMNWSDGYGAGGLYLFEEDGTKSLYLSAFGALSPDVQKIAAVDVPYLTVAEIGSDDVEEYELPLPGEWNVVGWSPDLRHLTLTYRSNDNDRYYDIYLFDLSSASFSQFTNDTDYFKYSPTFSPDGLLIAYATWRFTDDGVERRLIISRLDRGCEWTMPVGDILDFAWSPDNSRMFLTGRSGVYVADLNIVFGSGYSGGYHC